MTTSYELTSDEREAMAKSSILMRKHIGKASIDIGAHEGESDYTPYERMSIRPTLDVLMVYGEDILTRWCEDGYRVYCNGKDESMRLVPHQDHDNDHQAFHKTLQENSSFKCESESNGNARSFTRSYPYR